MFRVSVFSVMTAVPHLHLSDKQMLTFPVLRLRTIIVPYERFCKHACQSSPQRCRIIERSERVCICEVDSLLRFGEMLSVDVLVESKSQKF